MIVQRGTILEYFQIEALRRAYFEAWGEPVHRRPGGTIWWIAREGDGVLACTSYVDQDEGRMMQDFYCVDGAIGVRALRRLKEELYRQADHDGIRLVIPCNPKNVPMLRAYGWKITLTPTRHRQDLEPVAVIMIREPKEA